MPRCLLGLLLLGFALGYSTEPALGGTVIRGVTIDSLAVGVDTTSMVFDVQKFGSAAFAVQANCDSLQVTMQMSLDNVVWASATGPSWPIQINGTAGSSVLHILPRSLHVLPPDATISSDYAPTTMCAPYLRVYFNNNDTGDKAYAIVFRLLLGD